jgi:hypothetical protein
MGGDAFRFQGAGVWNALQQKKLKLENKSNERMQEIPFRGIPILRAHMA